MLVLTRKLGEAVRIGADVELYVVGVSRGRVQLGFRAPRNIAIQRVECADRVVEPTPVDVPIGPIVASGDRREMGSNPPLRAFRSLSGV